MVARVPAKQLDAVVDAALGARRAAYSPYSRYKVGAALLCDDGTIVAGCNVENASYGLALCAERNALTTAIADGRRGFALLAVATSSSPPAPPCGLCLQFLAEFCLDLPIVLVNDKGERARTRLAKLMPKPFRWKGVGT